jgi:FkbM family methyltransferase
MTMDRATLEDMLGPDWPAAAATRRRQIENRVAGRTNVLLFGTGYLGRHVLTELPQLGYRAIGWVDNNAVLWGTQVGGLEVYSPDDAARRFGDDVVWLITIYTNRPVIEQCRRLGVDWVTCAELSWLLPSPTPSFIFGTPDALAEDRHRIEAASAVWDDAASASEYRDQVRWRFLLDYAALSSPRPTQETYFPDDLVLPRDDEVFVDCGAFTGDTIEDFIARRSGRYRSVIGIEPDTVNAAAMATRFASWGQNGRGPIRVEPVAAGATRGTLTFETTGTAGSSVGSGSETVEVAPLDELVGADQPTYIKFDVEGAERDALTGGAAIIAEHAPVLAVCLYHRPHDLWDLPLLVRSFREDYRLYVRRYSDERWETVLYAVPAERVNRS